MSKHVILSLNESQQQWNVKDYIHLHATNGIRFYERAEEFEKEHKLGPFNTITILSGLIGYNVNDIREGKNFPIYSRIEEVLDFLFFAKEYISFWKNSKFVRSIVYIHNELSPKDILKLKNKVALFLLQNSQKDFLQMYENLLNKGRQNKIILVNNK